MKDKKQKSLNEPVSMEAQERLIEIMNDSSRSVPFAGTEWEIRALKPGTQWLICQEALSIKKEETASYTDVIKQFAVNVPSVVKVLTLALLNDREKIFANGRSGDFSELFNTTYQTIMWETNQGEWMRLLVAVMDMIDVEFFFASTSSITILHQRLLERKMTREEAEQLSHEQSSGK